MKGGFQPKSPKKGTHKRRKSNSTSKTTSSKSPSYTGGRKRSSAKKRSLKKILGGNGDLNEPCFDGKVCNSPLTCRPTKVFTGFGAKPGYALRCVQV